MKKSLMALCFATALFTGKENIQAQETNKLVGAVQKIPDKYELLTKKFEESLDMARTNRVAFTFYHSPPSEEIEKLSGMKMRYSCGFTGKGIECSYVPGDMEISFNDKTNSISYSFHDNQWTEFRGKFIKEGEITRTEFEPSRNIPKERGDRLLFEKVKPLFFIEVQNAF